MLVIEQLQLMREMGIGNEVSESALLTLLSNSNYNVETAISNYLHEVS